MRCRIADLRCKEVINVCDGLRMGYVSDVILNTAGARIFAKRAVGKIKRTVKIIIGKNR